MEKFIIDKELVESFVNVITSNDDEGIKMTMDILSNRDVKDKESESNFKEIMTKILKDDVLFPKTSISIMIVYVYKFIDVVLFEFILNSVCIVFAADFNCCCLYIKI